MDQKDKLDLRAKIEQINKEFGEGTMVPASVANKKLYRSSGSMALDVALGGGWAHSTIVDVIGRYSAGKTLLFQLAAVTAQKEEDRESALFDFEGSFDKDMFIKLGGDPERLWLIKAENFKNGKELFIEWAGDMLKQHLKHKMFACIGMDSTAAMVSMHEFNIKQEKGQEAQTTAYTARALSDLLRQIVGTGLVSRSGTTLFFMSQMRDNFSGRSFSGRPPDDNRTGGRALPFYASTQVEIKRGDTVKGDIQRDSGMVEEDVELGHEIKVRVRKNKNNANQGRIAAFDLYFKGDSMGLDRDKELLELSVATGAVAKSGAWLKFGDLQFHGKEKFTDAFNSDEGLKAKIKSATLTRLYLEQEVTEPEVLEGVDEEFDEEEARRIRDEASLAKLADVV